jgi:SAM-dependent methyltransferase
MAHPAQQEFISLAVKNFPNLFAGRVLDIGSLDINGDITNQFTASEYVGVDIGPGSNVTLVARGEDLDLKSSYFDVVISGECFEHNPAWKGTFSNMVRMTRPGGLVLMTCAGTLRTEHGTTRSDFGAGAPLSVEQGFEYYRNLSPRDLKRVIDQASFSNFKIFQNWAESDLYFIGIKLGGESEANTQFQILSLEAKNLVAGFNNPRRVLRTQLAAFEWRTKLKIVRRLIQLLGEERYRKFRKIVSFIGI